MDRHPLRGRVLALSLCVLAALCAAMSGCIQTAWQEALSTDTVGSYVQFLRDHPNSRHAGEARERIDFIRVQTYGTIEAYEEFRRRYPDSFLLPELRLAVEPFYFRRAREINTAESYQAFLAAYPDGKLLARARGNLAYVRQFSRATDLSTLKLFLKQYPESDFATEVEGTLSLLELRSQTAIRRLGVRVDVSPNVVQASRVRKGFASMIARYYRQRGVTPIFLRADQLPGPGMDAWMAIDYREAPAPGSFGTTTLVSYCRIRLYHRAFDEPIWDRSFEAPALHRVQTTYGRDKTVFANSGYPFWKKFFIPISTWATSKMRLNVLTYPEPVKAFDVLEDRGALLLDRGGVDFIDVASPATLSVRKRYRREIDLADWRGVRLLRRDLALTFGNDGAEFLALGGREVERLARWEAGDVGAVRGAALYDDHTLLMAGSQGLQAVRIQRAPLVPQRLLDGNILDVAVRDRFVYVVRADRVQVALPKHLLLHITAAQVGLGKGFRAKHVSRNGDRLYVFSDDEVVEVSIADPRPVVVSRLPLTELGQVFDLTADQMHRYVLGSRGLQVTSLDGSIVQDTIQVEADRSVTLKGRFAFLVGSNTLEVLDLSPYYRPRQVQVVRRPNRPKAKPVPEPESDDRQDDSPAIDVTQVLEQDAAGSDESPSPQPDSTGAPGQGQASGQALEPAAPAPPAAASEAADLPVDEEPTQEADAPPPVSPADDPE